MIASDKTPTVVRGRKLTFAVLFSIIVWAVLCAFPIGMKGMRIIYQKKMTDMEKRVSEQYAVTCWGDSLTAGACGDGVTFPNVLADCIAKKYMEVPVHNMGIGGENSITILGRAGVLEVKLTEETAIPADCVPVEVHFALADGSGFYPLRQGDGGMNPVRLGAISGTLSCRQRSIYDSSSDVQYFFTRAEAGTADKLQAGETLTVDNAGKYESDITVIFIGTNGGYSSTADLIAQQKRLIRNDRYLVIGLTCGAAADYAELDAEMEKAYGAHYFNLRAYLCENGLRLAGLPETAEDRAAIADGIVPPSLRSDSVHFNATGYRLIGEAVFERLDALGIWADLRSDAVQYRKWAEQIACLY